MLNETNLRPAVRLMDDEAPVEQTAAEVVARVAASRRCYKDALERLRQAATGTSSQTGRYTPAEIATGAPETRAWCRQAAFEIVSRINDESLGARRQRAFDRPDAEVVDDLLNEIFGLGPLEKILAIPDVEDISINGPNDIHYKAKGGWVKSDITFDSDEDLLRLLNHAVQHTQRTVSARTPIVDAALTTGHRINIVGAPIASPWPSAVIRIHREKSLSADELVACGMFSELSMRFLRQAVEAGYNILVIGGTGVGKTTVLNALGKLLPADRRIIIIEDTPEINLMRDNCQRLLTRPPSLEGLPEITPRDLVRVGLRQRPDALTLGEARGGEVLDLMKALRTGHRNGLTSIHANSIGDIYQRILFMLLEADLQIQLSEATVAQMVASSFDLAIMLRRTESGLRYAEAIVEFTGGAEGATVVQNTLFWYDRAARKMFCTGQMLDAPHHEAQLSEFGYSYQDILTEARERDELERERR